MPTAERALLHRGGRRGTWGSLGLWHDGEDDYASACEALALAVGRAAAVQRGDRVLSVACGAGDELLLWLQHCGASTVVGVEQDPLLVGAAERLVLGAGLFGGAHHAGVVLRVGSGTRLQALGLAPQSFDRVLCVDAAYHLRPRAAFLQGARALLRPGGRLAYTDLCLDSLGPPWRAPLLGPIVRSAARLCGLAAHELLSPAEQAARLQQLGFVDVQVQRLDEPVLGGFARYVVQQGRRISRTAWHPDWRRPGLTARLIGPCRAAGLGYVLAAGTLAAKVPAATDPAVSSLSPASLPATSYAERTALSSKGTPASA